MTLGDSDLLIAFSSGLAEGAKGFADGQPFRDDVTLLVVRAGAAGIA